MKKIITIPKTHIILGKTELNKEKFQAIKNITGFVKPKGGIWACPYYPEKEYISGWHEWCATEQDNWLTNDSVILQLKNDVKSFVINSQDSLVEFINIVGEAKDERSLMLSHINKIPDFQVASQLFDVIYLTEEGQCATRFPFNNHAYNLYGWDCESTLIMNMDCIESWEYKKLDIIK